MESPSQSNPRADISFNVRLCFLSIQERLNAERPRVQGSTVMGVFHGTDLQELKEARPLLCKRNVYFINEHIQYFILNIKSAICIRTTAMYSTKSFTAYLNIKRKRLQNCDVTCCDQAFKLTDDMRRKAEQL